MENQDEARITHAEMFELLRQQSGTSTLTDGVEDRPSLAASGSAVVETTPAVRRLSEPERTQLTDFYLRYLGDLKAKALSRLRKDVRSVNPGVSAVIQSALESFMEHHVDSFDLRDHSVLWLTLIEATLRHCEKWNQRIRRHPTPSLESMILRDNPETGQPEPFDPPAPAEESLLAAMLLELTESLTPREKTVLDGKRAKLSNALLADQLNVTEYQIEKAWDSIQEKALRVAQKNRD